MAETSPLETKHNVLCDDCTHTIPTGPVSFCPVCLANLCEECSDYHCCKVP